MSHVEFDRLWALAHRQLGDAEAREVRAHLDACPDCQAQLARIVLAQPMMVPPPVPELDAARWRAIDDKVFEAAAREMTRPSLLRTLRAWWDAPLFKPAFAAAALAAVVALVLLVGRGAPRGPEPVAVAPIAPVNEAAVLTAVDSEFESRALVADRKLARGSTISTRARGEAWLKLPDGSKLGVLASSKATLDQLEPQAVRVSLAEGAVAVSAVHEPARRLEVVAGRLSVRVVGTRFIVMRDEEDSRVVVEEGVVEASVDGKSQMVPAGSSLTVSMLGVESDAIEDDDRGEIQQIVPPRPPPPVKPPKPAVVVAADAGTQPAVVVEPPRPDAAATEAVAVVPADAGEESWAALPPKADAGEDDLPAPPAFFAVPVDGGKGQWLQEQIAILKLGRIPPFNLRPDRIPAKLKAWADDGHCDKVVAKVDEMLARWPKDGGNTPLREQILRGALEQRERCIKAPPAPKKRGRR